MSTAPYVSAFMDGLSWMLANTGSKPAEWRAAAHDCATMRASTLEQPDAIYQAGYDEGFQNGREQGMKQERALWELSAMGQAESRPAAEPGVLREALEAIQRWGLDTLSGRANGLPADVEWHRVGIREMTRRAVAALAAQEQEISSPAVEWVSIEDRRPKDYQPCLVAWDSRVGTQIYAITDDADGWLWYEVESGHLCEWDTDEVPTHWQPLPAPPAVQPKDAK